MRSYLSRIFQGEGDYVGAVVSSVQGTCINDQPSSYSLTILLISCLFLKKIRITYGLNFCVSSPYCRCAGEKVKWCSSLNVNRRQNSLTSRIVNTSRPFCRINNLFLGIRNVYFRKTVVSEGKGEDFAPCIVCQTTPLYMRVEEIILKTDQCFLCHPSEIPIYFFQTRCPVPNNEHN
jgi:hypothetical protein